MDKNYRLAHLLGPTLRHRRLKLNISEETIFEKFRIKIVAIEKTGDLHYNELIQLCKCYEWTLAQFFNAVEDLDNQKMV